jgi:ribosomal protein S18 acetylase RimI-like enzyme
MGEHHVGPRRAGAADTGVVASVLAEAMLDDPMVRWPLPPDAGIDHALAVFGPLARMYVELDAAWLVGSDRAAAAWLPPAAAARFSELEPSTRPEIVASTEDAGQRYGEFWDWLGAHVPAEPCWFLDVIGVVPAAQGLGLGRILVEHGLALAAADGLPAFLETGRAENVAYYERFGFRTVDRVEAPRGGPTIWFMST